MSDTENTTSSRQTVFQGLLIFTILVVGIIIIIYVIRNNSTVPYPISPFNFNDTVLISPVVLAQYGTGNHVNTNQYLTANFQGNSSCIQNSFMPANSCTLTFTGTPDSDSSKWILNQFFANGDPASDANQSLASGFGNRFYLQNKTQNQNNAAGRVRFTPFYACSQSGIQPWETFPTIGSVQTNSRQTSFYYQDLLVYFLPTNYPDIYYILFPGCTSGGSGVESDQAYTNTNDNNGIFSLRPYASPSDFGYYPYDANGNLYPNGPLLGILPAKQNSPADIFTNPEIYLFRVTKTF